MENRLPKKARALADKADVMALGAEQYGDTIPLTVVTKAAFPAKIEPVTDGIAAVDSGKADLSNKKAALLVLLGTARLFLANVREHLKYTHGQHHDSTKWDMTGFVGSLGIPTRETDLVQLLKAVKLFLTNNEAMELASKGITAAAAQTLVTQVQAARGAVNMQKKMVDDLMVDRDAKAVVLRKSMRDMIAELKSRLTPLDSRWLAFGLNKPGAQQTPDVPANVTAVLIGSAAAAVKWGASARADYYRLWMRVFGGSPEWVAVGSPADLDFTLEQLPGNSKIEVAVSAVNDGGESQRSEIVTVTTHA